jgi:hypothetical protein
MKKTSFISIFLFATLSVLWGTDPSEKPTEGPDKPNPSFYNGAYNRWSEDTELDTEGHPQAFRVRSTNILTQALRGEYAYQLFDHGQIHITVAPDKILILDLRNHEHREVIREALQGAPWVIEYQRYLSPGQRNPHDRYTRRTNTPPSPQDRITPFLHSYKIDQLYAWYDWIERHDLIQYLPSTIIQGYLQCIINLHGDWLPQHLQNSNPSIDTLKQIIQVIRSRNEANRAHDAQLRRALKINPRNTAEYRYLTHPNDPNVYEGPYGIWQDCYTLDEQGQSRQFRAASNNLILHLRRTGRMHLDPDLGLIFRTDNGYRRFNMNEPLARQNLIETLQGTPLYIQYRTLPLNGESPRESEWMPHPNLRIFLPWKMLYLDCLLQFLNYLDAHGLIECIPAELFEKDLPYIMRSMAERHVQLQDLEGDKTAPLLKVLQIFMYATRIIGHERLCKLVENGRLRKSFSYVRSSILKGQDWKLAFIFFPEEFYNELPTWHNHNPGPAMRHRLAKRLPLLHRIRRAYTRPSILQEDPSLHRLQNELDQQLRLNEGTFALRERSAIPWLHLLILETLEIIRIMEFNRAQRLREPIRNYNFVEIFRIRPLLPLYEAPAIRLPSTNGDDRLETMLQAAQRRPVLMDPLPEPTEPPLLRALWNQNWELQAHMVRVFLYLLTTRAAFREFSD